MIRGTAVYRLFDAAGSLLYVGVANRPEARFRTHASEKRWWDQVTSTTVEWYPVRAEALDAEAAAVHAESPRYNIMIPSADGTGRPRIRRDAPADAWFAGRPHWEARPSHRAAPTARAAHAASPGS